MEQEEGLSLFDIFKIVMSKKIVLVISFALSAFVILFLILFIYNKIIPKYEVSFDYRWYGIENDMYANNEPFNYYDIISLDNIRTVKGSDEKYKDLNVYEISEGIELEKNEDRYFLKANVSLFKDEELGKEFITDLIYKPYLYATNLNFEFKSNLKAYDDSDKIYLKLEYLDKQIEFLMNSYDDLISFFGDIEVSNKALSLLLEEVEVFNANNPISQYRYLTYKNTYMTEVEYLSSKDELESLNVERVILNNRKETLLHSIENIYKSSENNSYIDSALSGYLDSLHELDFRLISIEENTLLINDALAGKYNKEESEAFLLELDEYSNQLDMLTEKYSNAVDEVLDKNTFINIYSYEISGKINSLLTSLVSLFGGLVVGLGISFILGYVKYDKLRNKKNV